MSGWTNTQDFPFMVVDPTTGNAILVIDSTGLHLNGTVGHIDMQVSGGQPTIFFANPARTSQAYINAPGGNSVATGSPDYASSLPGTPSIHNLGWVYAGAVELGQVLAGGVTFLGAHLKLTDASVVLEYLDETITTKSKLFGNKFGMYLGDTNGNGAGVSASSGFLHRVVAGAYQGSNALASLYQNGWTDLGGNWAPGEYRVGADGWVNFHGVIINGTRTDGTVMWTMPAGLWPSKDEICDVTVISAGGAANSNLRVFSATGQVQCFGISGTTTGNIALNSMRYPLW